ncbi:porin family protein [Haliangium ochraceum]|uniref:CRIB domain-containing protein n=1 Tax=Haliangium ochraceum (strain DSM 14365 / JCM 11303 / SMP-2) TaxID=502025 RepID=D0LVA6_HALO1|nr:porin family protein [Haliangium ochraceum]ACY17467.1 hypothetical protein Hoch_4978 [Haliangium ochraceum DSM 14365]
MSKRLGIIVLAGAAIIALPTAAIGDVEHELHIGAQSGAVWSELFRSEPISSPNEATYNRRFFGGLALRLNTNAWDWLSLGAQLELQYDRKGARIESGGVRVGDRYLNYLDVPLLVRATFSPSRYAKPYFAAGPRLGVLVGAEREDFNGNIQDQSDFYDSVDFGVHVALGVGVQLNERLTVEIEGRYDVGLSDVDSASAQPGLRNRSFFLVLGVDYELWRSGGSGEPPR